MTRTSDVWTRASCAITGADALRFEMKFAQCKARNRKKLKKNQKSRSANIDAVVDLCEVLLASALATVFRGHLITQFAVRFANQAKSSRIGTWFACYQVQYRREGFFVGADLLELCMKNRTQKCLGYEPDDELTESETSRYFWEEHGIEYPVSRLQRSRIGLCPGPAFLKIDGRAIRYTPRLIDEYVEFFRTEIVTPYLRRASS